MSTLQKNKNILFILTGSIACYKVVQVISSLVKENFNVECVMTSGAQNFIGISTLEGITGNKIYLDLYESGYAMAHISLVRRADLIVVAPATANYINKIAQGVGDDLASTLFLAYDFKKPFLIFPAMNVAMFEHPLTKEAIVKLKKIGICILDTAQGSLACGEEGYGRLLEPEEILRKIKEHLNLKEFQPIKFHGDACRILITGGGTVEKIDSVRSITNSSSGNTAVDLANSLSERGFLVTLLLSEQNQRKLSSQVSVRRFLSSSDLDSLCLKELSVKHYDFVIHAAAVSDFSVKEIQINDSAEAIKYDLNKLKMSSESEITLILKKNKKIISDLKNYSLNQNVKIIAFKLMPKSSQIDIETAVRKVFNHSGVSFVVHNSVEDLVAQKDSRKFSIYSTNKGNIESQQVDGVSGLAHQISMLMVGG
ncbi:MAG: bifunctional phosphopantothenoylcysteine decarboxylase/phosphopantothenate--cysteine ligase CoaBC [Bdellovibrionaceae bacterium]|nr:bifunctional phosphopantothenoylcysteine decarboxylase/phosphopantothenate--cysteine ligase CoaBC [Pseudobdellovibrionaceae bacterium]